MRFIIENVRDEIQKEWANGRFYEEKELHDIKQLSRTGWRILDIGANVGNHSIYFDKYLNPEVIFAIEPDIRSYKILLQNAALNHCHRINFDHIGIAFSNTEGNLSISHSEENNLGATRFTENIMGNILSVPGDRFFANQKIDFIKIDVEGMEFEVLEGLNKTIHNNKPSMFIEVQNSNIKKFENYVNENQYQIVKTYRNYTTCINYLIRNNHGS